jgi:putative addiction module component (TIGR02574 family)
MSLSLDELAEAAMLLPDDSRMELAEKLIGSLDFPVSDANHGLWAAESVRRRDEVRSGRVTPISGEEVLDEVRRLVGR